MDASAASGALGACEWPARFDRGDAAPRGACHAGRHLLSCQFSGGGSVGLSADAGTGSCEDQCKANEYAIACGAVGPDTGNPDPPSNCRNASNTPAGVFFMCCPCE
jgi:hypothetical protein